MPFPPPNQPPYDDVETILNFARVIANDCGLSLAGNLLSDAQPYTYTMLNIAWRKLQSKLANNAIEEFPQEIIVSGVPAQAMSALQDMGIQSYLDFSGYNDGVSVYDSVRLPPDLEIPLRLWERVAGQKTEFIPMFPAIDGLPTEPKGGLLRVWEWRDDAIYFLGSSQPVDLRIRYKRILPDSTTNTVVIPLIRCAVPLAYLLVEVFAAGRGSTILPVFNQEKDNEIKQLINSTTRKKQRSNFRRIPYSRRGSFWQ